MQIRKLQEKDTTKWNGRPKVPAIIMGGLGSGFLTWPHLGEVLHESVVDHKGDTDI